MQEPPHRPPESMRQIGSSGLRFIFHLPQSQRPSDKSTNRPPSLGILVFAFGSIFPFASGCPNCLCLPTLLLLPPSSPARGWSRNAVNCAYQFLAPLAICMHRHHPSQFAFRTIGLALIAIPAFAQENQNPPDPFAATKPPVAFKSNSPEFENGRIEKLTESSLPSLVAITHMGRDGKVRGTGTGFIISADGLIATNLHVIGDARPIQVELHDGKTYDVSEIHAWDRRADIAIIKIDAKEKLRPLSIGNSEDIKQGQPIVAFGNPPRPAVQCGQWRGFRDPQTRGRIHR
jgi:hypothetical protein